jgi:DNA polymerase-3 subunit alpha
LDEFEEYLSDNTLPIDKLTLDMEAKQVKIGGIVTNVKKIVTRNGANMLFCGLESKNGATELIVFPKVLEESQQLWQPDNIIEVDGKVSTKDREGRVGTEIKVIVDKAKIIGHRDIREHRTKKKSDMISSTLRIKLGSTSDNKKLLEIKKILESNPGDNEIRLIANNKEIKLPFRAKINRLLIDQLAEVVGKNNLNV